MEGRIRGIKGLPTHTEGRGDLGDRLSVDSVTPQHLVSNLHAVLRIKELVLLKGLVAHGLRMGMERMMLAKRAGFAVFSLRWFRARHIRQLNYIHRGQSVKHFLLG